MVQWGVGRDTSQVNSLAEDTEKSGSLGRASGEPELRIHGGEGPGPYHRQQEECGQGDLQDTGHGAPQPAPLASHASSRWSAPRCPQAREEGKA